MNKSNSGRGCLTFGEVARLLERLCDFWRGCLTFWRGCVTFVKVVWLLERLCDFWRDCATFGEVVCLLKRLGELNFKILNKIQQEQLLIYWLKRGNMMELNITSAMRRFELSIMSQWQKSLFYPIISYLSQSVSVHCNQCNAIWLRVFLIISGDGGLSNCYELVQQFCNFEL